MLLIIFLLTSFSHAQWSTSPYADSGLYVCPGFVPGIVTFEDGSSVVLGILSSYIFAQKLDPQGYKVWPEPVVVHHNDSSDMFIGGESDRDWFCSDGDGGVIVFWQDYRDAYLICNESFCDYKNNTTYIQRIDKNGNKCWGDSGIIVSGVDEGLKETRITEDGEGGCALLMWEMQFDYPGAGDKNYLKILRYNSIGEQLWQTVLDSAFTKQTIFQLNYILRGGDFYYLTYYKDKNILKRININGELESDKVLQYSGVVTLNNLDVFFLDVDAFMSDYYKISKVDYKADTIWTKTVSFQNFCNQGGGQLVPDNLGGVFITHICHDSIMYFDSDGILYYKEFYGIDIGGFEFPDGNNGIITYNTSMAKRYNSSGVSLWQNGVTYLNDPENAYSEYYAPDNNGGLIIAYWSTIGGIFVQHTGRNGQLGIVTGLNDYTDYHPRSFELFQNYPNPFNSSTTIRFSIHKKSNVKISITNILGQHLADIVNRDVNPGDYRVRWNAEGYATGVYFYTLFVNEEAVLTKRLLHAK